MTPTRPKTRSGRAADSVLHRGEVPVELGQALHEFASGALNLEGLEDRFLAARIYTLSPVRPGLFVLSRPSGAAIVPVWTTVRGMRQVMGDFDRVALTGQDVLDHLPPGVAVLIDAGMQHCVALQHLARNRCAS